MATSACESSATSPNPVAVVATADAASPPDARPSVSPVASITHVMHVNVNVSDFERSRRFYEALGFQALLEVEDVADAEAAAGLDMPPYRLLASPMALPDGSILDLIQWLDPYDDAPPYARADDPGINWFALVTSDLDADMVRLSDLGVTFHSDPGRFEGPEGGYRAVLLHDPDGTRIELVELLEGDTKPDAGAIHVAGMFRVYVNVTDLDDSLTFYERLGFSAGAREETAGSPDLERWHGVPSFPRRRVHLTLASGPAVVAQQWADDRGDAEPAYAKLNHLGIARMALNTTDITADVAALRDLGYGFYSDPVTPEGAFSSLSFACVEDPDGAVMELVEIAPP